MYLIENRFNPRYNSKAEQKSLVAQAISECHSNRYVIAKL